jgi:hypothetical protein
MTCRNYLDAHALSGEGTQRVKDHAKAIDMKTNIEYRTRNYESRSSEKKPKNCPSLSLQHSEFLVHYSIFRVVAQNKPG